MPETDVRPLDRVEPKVSASRKSLVFDWISSLPDNCDQEVANISTSHGETTGDKEDTTLRAPPQAKRVHDRPARRRNVHWTSDLVLDSRLETKIAGRQTQHVSYKSIASAQQREITVEELWARKRKIGNGTYGRVWLEYCYQGPTMGSLRAVKVIPKIQAGVEINYKRELEAVTKFSQAKYVHCFVQSLGWYEDDRSVYIAMEYLDHGDLQKRLDRRYPDIEVKTIASQLLEGLNFMHDNGFTHRDLKPGNILVMRPSPEWWIKIGDFGISKRVKEGSTSLRTRIGTRGYLAPEVIGYFPISDGPANHGIGSYTSAVDIWALGEICFRLLTNQPAFSSAGKLYNYVTWGHEFPFAPLQDAGTSNDCVDFIKLTMSASAARRPSTRGVLSSVWLKTEGKEVSSSRISQGERTTKVENLADTEALDATADWSTLPGLPIPPPVLQQPQSRPLEDYIIDPCNREEASKSGRKSSWSKRAHQGPLVPTRNEVDVGDVVDARSLAAYALAAEKSNASRYPIQVEIAPGRPRRRRKGKPASPLIPAADSKLSSYVLPNTSEIVAILLESRKAATLDAFTT